MTEPKKTEPFLEGLTQALFGRSRKEGACVTCGTDKVKPEDFRNAVSLKEWGLSRMCQGCQDDFFGVSE